MSSEFRMYFNNQAASLSQLDLFNEIRVDQSIGLTTEAEVKISIEIDEDGRWSVIEEDFIQPFQRMRIEVNVNKSQYVPLIDGPIVAQRFEVSAVPGESNVVLTVHDDSALLNLNEIVKVYEEMSASDIATSLFQEQGFLLNVESVVSPTEDLERVVVQRGTSMKLIKGLAKKHGMYAYVLPGDMPGTSVGVFAKPQLNTGSFPELVLMGKNRNFNKLDVDFDGLRPVSVISHATSAGDHIETDSHISNSDEKVLGDIASHDLVDAGSIMLSRNCAESGDTLLAATAAANHSAWAYTARAEIDTEDYPAVLMPYKTVTVAGAGGHLSGDYLINHVSHTINSSSYKQTLGLQRNARLGGASPLLPSIPAGIF